MLKMVLELCYVTSFLFHLLCLHCKNDLFPEEGVWHWRNGMPLLSALRTIAVGSLLGPQKEGQVDWYLESGHIEKLLSQLRPHLDKIAQIIQHYAISVCVLSRKLYLRIDIFFPLLFLEGRAMLQFENFILNGNFLYVF